MIYLHSTDEREREIPGALGTLAAGELDRKPRRARDQHRQPNGHATGTGNRKYLMQINRNASELGNCGAKGTRTPDPLLANKRRHVHQRPSPLVTVPGRASGSVRIPVCCGTFLLYSPPWSGTAQIPCDSPLCSPQEHERAHFKPTC